MTRAIRRVPPNWQHPKTWQCTTEGPSFDFKPLLPGEKYLQDVCEWDEKHHAWNSGIRPEGSEECQYYEQWAGQRPHIDDYMPDWPLEQCTHFMMYETTTEGTPISPVFACLNDLAHWLADSKATVFARSTLNFEQWLELCVATAGKQIGRGSGDGN